MVNARPQRANMLTLIGTTVMRHSMVSCAFRALKTMPCTSAANAARVLRLAQIVVVLAATLLSAPALSDLRAVVVRADGVNVWFSVEVAETPAQRLTGLMYRKYLAPRHGLWFDFQHDSQIVMWMKNTEIPLDMIFVTANGTVAAVEEGAEPHALKRIVAPLPVRYVLEINAGEVARYLIRADDRALLVGP